MTAKKAWTINAIAIAVVWACTFVGGVWMASADWSAVKTQASRIDDHEARLRQIENQLSNVAADVRWIRQSMEAGE